MAHRIYRMTENAWNGGMIWDDAINDGELETVAEFESIEEAIDYFETVLNGDSEHYGVE